MDQVSLLRRVARADVAATAPTRTVVECGPLTLLLDPGGSFPGINWATAQQPGATAGDVAAMRRAFGEHDRAPRLEFVAEVVPDLAPLLEQAGFVLEEAQPLMIATPESFRPFAAPGVSVRFLEATSPDQDFATLIEVQGRGFGFPAEASPERIAHWRARILAGKRDALAYLEGRPVTAGGTSAWEGVAELQGIATLPEARRRGAAATLSSALTEDHFRDGDLAWLSAGDGIARRTYEKIGFRVAGTRLNYGLPV